MEKIPQPNPVASQEEQREKQRLGKKIESAKVEVREAIKSGDMKLALGTFLRLQEFLPTSFKGEKYDYSGSFAKDIMQKAIKAAGAEGASSEDIKSMVEIYLSSSIFSD